MKRIIFTCDIPSCKKEFSNRDEKGQPVQVGGIQGVKVNLLEKDPTRRFQPLNADFCPEHFSKILDFANKLK